MTDLEFNKNEDSLKLLISEMKRKHAIIALGGGAFLNEKITKVRIIASIFALMGVLLSNYF